jgi:hypothetical protein
VRRRAARVAVVTPLVCRDVAALCCFFFLWRRLVHDRGRGARRDCVAGARPVSVHEAGECCRCVSMRPLCGLSWCWLQLCRCRCPCRWAASLGATPMLDPAAMYVRGKPTNVCTVIMSGSVSVESGEDGQWPCGATEAEAPPSCKPIDSSLCVCTCVSAFLCARKHVCACVCVCECACACVCVCVCSLRVQG